MSVVLLCALSYNRDLQGQRCGYDCIAVSTAMSKVVSLPAIEVAYLPAPGSDGDSAAQFDGLLKAEISYGVAAHILQAVVSAVPRYEISYTYLALPIVQCTGISAEVAFPRYLYPAIAQTLASKAELCFGDALSARMANAGGIKAEYSCVPLQQSGSARLAQSSIAEIAYVCNLDPGVDPDPDAPPVDITDVTTQLINKITAESTWSVPVTLPGCTATSPIIEVAYLQEAIRDNGSDSSFSTASKLEAEISYACASSSVNPSARAGVDSVGIELAFSSKEDNDSLSSYLTCRSVAAEATVSTWSGNASPAAQSWQVVVGDDPENPMPTDDTVYVPCLSSDSLVMIGTDSGTVNGMIYYPSTVSCLRKNELLSVVNAGLRIVDLTWTNPDQYYQVRPGVTSVTYADNFAVFTCIDGVAVILDGDNNLTYVDIPIQVICSAYDTVNKVYCLGCQDGTVYFLTSSFTVKSETSLKGPIVQIQRSQYSSTPCFVVTSQGSRSVSIYSAENAKLLSSTAVTGTLRSGLYSISNLSLYSTIAESADVFRARSDLIWFPNQLSIKGQPWCLTVKGSRVYYTDSERTTVGWI